MKNFNLLFFIMVLLIHSCEQKGTYKSIEEVSIDDLSSKNIIDVSQYVDTILLYDFEYSRESLLSYSQSEIIEHDDFFYFIKYSQIDMVMIFSKKDGRFIKKLEPTGGGPNEFTAIRNCTINPYSKKIELFADFESKLIEYDLEGNHLDEKPFSLLFDQKIILLDKNKLYYCKSSNSDYLNTDQNISLMITNQQNKPTKFLKSQDKIKADLFSPSTLYWYKDTVRFIAPYCDTVYSIFKNNIKPRYKINFKSKKLSPDFWKDKDVNSTKDMIFSQYSLPWVYPSIFENDDMIFGYYTSSNSLGYYFIYDKNMKKTAFDGVIIKYNKWDMPLPPPSHFDQEGFNYLISPSELKAMLKEHPNPSILPKSFVSKIQNAPIDGNPLLMQVKMKRKSR